MNDEIDLSQIPITEESSLDKNKIIERLKVMQVKFLPGVFGKKYYLDLYNIAIQDVNNRNKIANLLIDDIKNKVVKRTNNDVEIKNKMIGDSKLDKVTKVDLDNNGEEELTFNHYFSFKNDGKINSTCKDNNNNFNIQCTHSYGKETKDSSYSKSNISNFGQGNQFDICQQEEGLFQRKEENKLNFKTLNSEDNITEESGNSKLNIEEIKSDDSNTENNTLIIQENNQSSLQNNLIVEKEEINKENDCQSVKSSNINNDKINNNDEEEQIFTKLPQKKNQINSLSISRQSFPFYSVPNENNINNDNKQKNEKEQTIPKEDKQLNEIITINKQTKNNASQFFIEEPKNTSKNKLFFRLILPLFWLLLIWFMIIVLVHIFNDPTDFQSTFDNIINSLQMSTERWIILCFIAIIFLIVNRILNKRRSHS
jgi:hypothetical protein